MADNTDNLVQKDVCEKEHQVIKEKFTDLKANIHTSKESLSNRLDEVDIALLGDRKSPGGLLRDFAEMKEELDRHEEEVNTEIKHHKENVTKEIKFLNKTVWVAIGISVIAMGGKFFGIDVSTIKNVFSNKTTPVVAPAPEIKENNDVPEELKILIKEFIENQEQYQKKHINIEKPLFENNWTNTINEIITPMEENE